jgi:hypothetical protein
MAKKSKKSKSNRKNKAHGHSVKKRATLGGDTPTEETITKEIIKRVEALTGDIDLPALFGGELGRKIDELDATTDEEIDALQVDLLQERDLPEPSRGSGRIVDDLSEENLAGFTEVGPDASIRGARSVVPGREDTSETLRRHHPYIENVPEDAIVEANLDEPMDEIRDAEFDEDSDA